MGLAKGSQKVMASALGAADKPVIMSLMTLGVLRALEYGLLGWALAWLVSRQQSRAWHFVLAGALAGLVFGGSITWLTIAIATAKDMVDGAAANHRHGAQRDGFPDRLRVGRLHRAAASGGS